MGMNVGARLHMCARPSLCLPQVEPLPAARRVEGRSLERKAAGCGEAEWLGAGGRRDRKHHAPKRQRPISARSRSRRRADVADHRRHARRRGVPLLFLAVHRPLPCCSQPQGRPKDPVEEESGAARGREIRGPRGGAFHDGMKRSMHDCAARFGGKRSHTCAGYARETFGAVEHIMQWEDGDTLVIGSLARGPQSPRVLHWRSSEEQRHKPGHRMGLGGPISPSDPSLDRSPLATPLSAYPCRYVLGPVLRSRDARDLRFHRWTEAERAGWLGLWSWRLAPTAPLRTQWP